jgi:hypothetical protein
LRSPPPHFRVRLPLIFVLRCPSFSSSPPPHFPPHLPLIFANAWP